MQDCRPSDEIITEPKELEPGAASMPKLSGRDSAARSIGSDIALDGKIMPLAASSQGKCLNRKYMTVWLSSYGKLFLNHTYAVFGVSAHPHPLDEASELR